MKRKTLLWLPAAIALVGASITIMLLWPRRPTSKPAATGAAPAPRAGATVRAVLHLGRRVGRIEEWEGGAAKGRPHWVRTLLHVKRGNRRALLRRTVSARLRADGSLTEATLTAGKLTTSVRVTPTGARLTVAVGDRRSTHDLPTSGPIHLESTAFRWLARTGLRPGRTEKLGLLDLEHGWVRPVEVHVRGPRRWHGLAGTEIELREATGIIWSATLDAGGRVLESDSLIPGVQTRRWRPGDEDRPLHTVDLGAWGLVMTSGGIRDPARVRRLRLKLRGLPRGFSGPAERELVAPQLVAATAPATRVDPALTRPAPFLESDAPGIRERARELAPPGTPVVEAARKIARWVNENVRQGDVVGPPSALATLHSRLGNCNELAALTVALLRAAGHPSRIAFGVAYYQGSFRYHAWPEVQVGSKLVPLDPTLAQIPADATHLRLSAGGLEAQAAILHLAGRLTVEITSVDEGNG